MVVPKTSAAEFIGEGGFWAKTGSVLMMHSMGVSIALGMGL